MNKTRTTFKETDPSAIGKESNDSFEDLDGSLISGDAFNEYLKKMGMREYDNGTVIFYEDEYDNS